MKRRDSFTVYLSGLDAGDVDFRVIADGRHILNITLDVGLYVRPAEDDLPAVIAGLRKLAAAAGEMAGALSGDDPASPLEEIRVLLAAFDWEHSDRQLALEEIDRIVNGDGR